MKKGMGISVLAILTAIILGAGVVSAVCSPLPSGQVYVGGKDLHALAKIAELQNIKPAGKTTGFLADVNTAKKICALTEDYYAQLENGWCEANVRLAGVSGNLNKPYTGYVKHDTVTFRSCGDNSIYKWDGSKWVDAGCSSSTNIIHAVVCKYVEPPCVPSISDCSTAYPGSCGMESDGCANVLDCSANCGAGYKCDSTTKTCVCDESQTTHWCAGKECGESSCGVDCGNCNPGKTCDSSGNCIVSQQAYWTNTIMESIGTTDSTGTNSRADVGDSVLLILNNSGLAEGAEVQFDIAEDDSIEDDSIRIITGKVDANGMAIARWVITQEDYDKSTNFLDPESDSNAEFYFTANGIPSDYLMVNKNSYNNNHPETEIITPLPESSYVIKTADGKTYEINFKQESKDKDDLLRITWDFGDGSEPVVFEDCFYNPNAPYHMNMSCLAESNNDKLNVNGNTTYQYDRFGTKIVTLTAEEKERSMNQKAEDKSRIYVYREGLNIFAIINSPNYKMPLYGSVKVNVNGQSSHVAKCFSNNLECTNEGSPVQKVCYPISDGIVPAIELYCYKYASSSALAYEWIIDGEKDTEHITDMIFDKIFNIPKLHLINLKVSYTY